MLSVRCCFLYIQRKDSPESDYASHWVYVFHADILCFITKTHFIFCGYEPSKTTKVFLFLIFEVTFNPDDILHHKCQYLNNKCVGCFEKNFYLFLFCIFHLYQVFSNHFSSMDLFDSHFLLAIPHSDSMFIHQFSRNFFQSFHFLFLY